MKSDAIDAWLQHWLKIQKKGKRPLVLKDGSEKASDQDANKNPKVVDRRTSKKSKDGYIEPDDDEEAPQIDDGAADGLLVPKSPSSVSPTDARRRSFLKSLSDDVQYKELLLLLLAAKVSNISSVFTWTDP